MSGYELTFPDKIKIENIVNKKYYIGDYREKNGEGESIAGAANEAGIDLSDTKISRASELEGDERRIYEALLKGGALAAEEIAAEGISMESAVYRLTLLEIKGYVISLPGGKYTVK